MPEPRPSAERTELLADVAEMYYLEDKTQAQIAKRIGVTRSMVSRMLSDVRRLGIVKIQISRPLQFDRELEAALIARFHLRGACVPVRRNEDDSARLLRRLGSAGAHALQQYLAASGLTLGLAWGTSISATVEALEVEEPVRVKIVQLVGSLGARNLEYDAIALAQRTVQRLGGEAFYLNAPFLVHNPDIARALIADRSMSETTRLWKHCDVVLLGIGGTDPNHSSFYLAGYVGLDELNALIEAGAVGDVCGRHFDADGRPVNADFHQRIVGIEEDELRAVPIRLGVAGGEGKVRPILAALRGNYVNVLVTDSVTAKALLRQDQQAD